MRVDARGTVDFSADWRIGLTGEIYEHTVNQLVLCDAADWPKLSALCTPLRPLQA
jgi:hypothetical protein